MSGDWLTKLPATANGLPVQRPAVTDVVMPAGYTEALPLVDPFEAYCFQSFRRTNADGSTTYALPTDARHDNSGGVVHGGLLMTFADSVLGYCAWSACPPETWCVTVSQSSSFLKGVRPGDLVEVTPVVTRATRTMIFTRGEFLVGGEPVFQAASIWKVTGK
jgi:acyl-coenzyme A thioesterase PaaI-like protein